MGTEKSESGQLAGNDEVSVDDVGSETSEADVSPGNGSDQRSPEDAPPELTGDASPPRGKGRMVTAVAVALALVVGVVVGWAVGSSASSDDDGGEADAADAEDSESHADHPDGGATSEDNGLDQLLADHHFHEPSDEPLDSEERQLLTVQLTAVNELVEEYPTLADAETNDWRRVGPFIPGLGTHYIPKDTDSTFTIPTSVDADEDEGQEVRPLLIFEGLEDDSPLAGFMFLALGEEPADFAGPYDTWHQHTNVCVVQRDGVIDTPFVADMNVTDEMCEDAGGSLTDLTSHMVHIWSIPGYESELGLFSEVNPKITCPDGTYHRVPYDELESPYKTVCPS